jgi:hypothetical protein
MIVVNDIVQSESDMNIKIGNPETFANTSDRIGRNLAII